MTAQTLSNEVPPIPDDVELLSERSLRTRLIYELVDQIDCVVVVTRKPDP
jgi:hypothetical protein